MGDEKIEPRGGGDDEGSVDTVVGNDAVSPPTAPFANTEIPNGGLTAWLQVLGSFFLFFNSWYLPVSVTCHHFLPPPSTF